MKSPTIVINAYNRPDSIQRLLSSLQQAIIPDKTDLVFSLEYDPHPNVRDQIQQFEWTYGSKEIIQQEKKLGLIGHFLFCGGLTEKYGDIIYLEDDLFVSAQFYNYSQQVLDQYGDEEDIAGFSLNALWFNGYLHMPFNPIDDGNPCFFLQVPWYQGQIYTEKQWSHFKEWYVNRSDMEDKLLIHDLFRNYQLQDDWFPIKTQYLIESKKFYCFPRIAHCVNFGDEGVHFNKRTNFFQTELSIGLIHSRFLSFDESLAVYDSFYELIPEKVLAIAPHLNSLDITFDLNGTKDWSLLNSEYVLTSVAQDHYLKSYGLEMRPQELNIAYQIEGDHFFLTRRVQLKNGKNSHSRLLRRFDYHYRFKLSWVLRWKVLFNRLFKFW